jgi:hypothetical protein
MKKMGRMWVDEVIDESAELEVVVKKGNKKKKK